MGRNKKEITLDNLTSALKTVYGPKTEAVLLLFRHWVKNNYDMTKATPELTREIEDAFLERYSTAKPLNRDDALVLLDVYGEHFYKTATPEERAAFAIAAGYTPLEYEIMGEGFTMRELMQALKTIEGRKLSLPEALLTECFERYARCWLNWTQPITNMPQLLEQYRREPGMKSGERARAILKAFGVRLLDANNPEDVQRWKEVSGVQEH